MSHLRKRFLAAKYSWLSLFEGAFACAWGYVFLEWLFIVTKPSFLSAVPLGQKVRIFLFSAALFTAVVFVVLGGLYLLARVTRASPVDRVLRLMAALVLALILASLGLLLADNFTNTVFGFGIASTSGWTVLPYLVGFLLLIGSLFLDLKKGLAALDRWLAPRPWRRYFDLALACFLAVILALTYQRPMDSVRGNSLAVEGQKQRTPNILLITADALNAEHSSLYGYERETTPNIKALAAGSLVALNAFNNSGNTMGSVISMYTGKYPTTTRTLYAPDILKGEDAYQHLPNILRQSGYYNIQYTHPHHADAYVRNVLAGFDEANGKTIGQNTVLNLLNRFLTTDAAYFQYELANRLVDRLRHIAYHKRMLSQQEILFGDTQVFHDTEKLERVLEVLSDGHKPVFAHVHWMGTHGATHIPKNRTFSRDKAVETQETWDVDFYDDSILDFDDAVGQLIDRLKALGMYDNTILIISSDHSQNNGTIHRIPLVIHFPEGQHKGRLVSNVQTIDIAPTVLDYLGMRKPAWMEGVSLMDGEPGDRPIFAVGVGGNIKLENREVVTDLLKPPFYQFGFMSVVYCGAWYELDFTTLQWEQGDVSGAVEACEDRPTGETVLGWMRGRLSADGFDVSTLEENLPSGQ